jgi:rSAM/selenodomain-associated transferase 2
VCMHSENQEIQLSIIIPVLNEAEGIGNLMSMLALQERICFEVIVCDGGSTDGTTDRIWELVDSLPYPLRYIRTEKGRGIQMNASARIARGAFLLFLHADSSFADRKALCDGLAAVVNHCEREGNDRVAARFQLGFQRCDDSNSFFYYYSESKARLDRQGCTHGDQGFLLSRHFFHETGGFDESCTVLEDTRLAEVVRAKGAWLLLPAQILTSVRRFETEGIAARQCLNAVIMTLDAVGREDLIRGLPGIYATQRSAGRLRLSPFLDALASLLSVGSPGDRMRFWCAVGGYAGRNAWQIAFAADVRTCFRNGMPPGSGDHIRLRFFDRYLGGIIRSRPVTVPVSCMIWLLYQLARLMGLKGRSC